MAFALEAETDLIVEKCDAAVSLTEAGKARRDALYAPSFPLERTGGTFELMIPGEARGKIVLSGEPRQH